MGKKKKKQRPVDEAPLGAPEWVVTFTDMISLLVTFFVLLMTFSSLDSRDLLKIDSWLSRSASVLNEEEGSMVQETLDVDQITATDLLRGARQPHSRPREELLDNLEEMGRKLTKDHLRVDLSQHIDGLILEFNEDAAFAPGSTVVTPELEKSLREAALVLQHYPFMVVVEGTADGEFRATSKYPTPEAISCARASAAAAVMLGYGGLQPEVVQIAGLGDTAPRGDDETAEGRRANRRVRVRVLSLSKMRAGHLEALDRAQDAAGGGR
jgi:chemotaxis protein MotB